MTRTVFDWASDTPSPKPSGYAELQNGNLRLRLSESGQVFVWVEIPFGHWQERKSVHKSCVGVASWAASLTDIHVSAIQAAVRKLNEKPAPRPEVAEWAKKAEHALGAYASNVNVCSVIREAMDLLNVPLTAEDLEEAEDPRA